MLDAQIGGEPTLRDRMTSDLTNVLMRGLGNAGRQSPEDVRKVRRAMRAGEGEGAWRAGRQAVPDVLTKNALRGSFELKRSERR